jgi:L-fucose isomerase-like protein
VIGKNGNVIKSLATESSVEVTLDAKEDAELTQERVLTVSGTVAACMNFTSLILHHLVAQNEARYVVNGTTYSRRSAGNPLVSRTAALGLPSSGGGNRPTFSVSGNRDQQDYRHSRLGSNVPQRSSSFDGNSNMDVHSVGIRNHPSSGFRGNGTNL